MRPTGTEIGPAFIGIHNLEATRETVGRVHRDRTDAIVAEVLLDLEHKQVVAADIQVVLSGRRGGALDGDGVVDLRQLVREYRLDHDALDRLDPSHVLFSCD